MVKLVYISINPSQTPTQKQKIKKKISFTMKLENGCSFNTTNTEASIAGTVFIHL